VQSDASYDYARALATSHPFDRLNLNFNSGYTSNETAAAIQQVLGQSSSVPGSILAGQTFASGRTIDFGAGAQFILPRGFSVSGDASGGTVNSPLYSNEDLLAWDAALNYLRRLGHSGSFTASYAYQHAEVDGATSTTRTLRTGFSSIIPHQVQLGASMQYDQSVFENTVPSLPSIESRGHGYGLVLNAGRPLATSWRISGDFELDHHVTEFPLNVTATVKGFGIRADSSAWELMLRRSYQSGLALQVGNGLVFVSNPEAALQTPLGTVLSLNSTVQTMFIGVLRPRRKRLSIVVSFVRFGYDNAGLPATDATLLNATVSYRFRRLALQTGYRSSNSHVYTLSSVVYEHREVYFEVLRHFRIF